MPDPALVSVLDWHLARYPALEAADIYKLVHQSVFGPGHIVRDLDSCRRRLAQEMVSLSTAAGIEPEEEPLDPQGFMGRISLRRLLGRPGAVERLTRVLVQTAATVHGRPEQMRGRLAETAAWCRDRLPEQADALAATVTEAGSCGFPARHHSARYVELYRPAYRVVRLDLWYQASDD